MPSLTASVVQGLAGAFFRGRLVRGDEVTLREALTRGRRPGAGDPPASFFRKCAVEIRQVGGHAIYDVRPAHAAAVRGHMLYLHGGGYVNPPAGLHWEFIARLANTLNLACSVPRYPLAPEHLCDEGVAFAVAEYGRLEAQHGAQRIVVMGDSAGGGLALATVQQVVAKPAGLLLNAPWLDAAVSDPSQVEIERHEWLLNRFVLRCWGQWWAGPRELTDTMVSPLFGDLSNLPPTLLFAGSADILVADARRLAAAAPDRVRYIEEAGLMHVYPLLSFLPEARRAWQEIEAFVDRLLPREL